MKRILCPYADAGDCEVYNNALSQIEGDGMVDIIRVSAGSPKYRCIAMESLTTSRPGRDLPFDVKPGLARRLSIGADVKDLECLHIRLLNMLDTLLPR